MPWEPGAEMSATTVVMGGPPPVVGRRLDERSAPAPKKTVEDHFDRLRRRRHEHGVGPSTAVHVTYDVR